MAGLTSEIEQFLLEMFDQKEDGVVEIGRNDLAQQFDCAPSQINYVLTTRFTTYNGYYIESRRGGSGYVRIIRLEKQPEDIIQEVQQAIGEGITTEKTHRLIRALEQQEVVSSQEARLMNMAVDDQALRTVPVEERNRVRASILKNMLLVFLR